MASGVRVYKEGILQKRARGLHTKRNIKWQERYCRLTSISLDYYDPKKMVSETDQCVKPYIYQIISILFVDCKQLYKNLLYDHNDKNILHQ